MSGKKAKEQRREESAKESTDEGRKTRPSRSTTLPAAPTDRTLDYAKRRDELKGMCPGDIVLAWEATHAYQSVMVPLLDAVEVLRRAPRPGERKRRGKPSQWTAHDFERMELLRRVIGAKSTQETRDWLAGDRAKRTRELFDMERDRPSAGGKPRILQAGIPSDGYMSDYRVKWFGEQARSDAHRLMERFLLVEKLMASPWGLAELDLLYADGSKLETHYTPPKKKYGKVCNDELRPNRDGTKMRCPITAPDAGYIPNRGTNADHSGAGWNILFISTIKGTILARRCVPMHAAENGTLAGMVEELGAVLSQFENRLRVLSADGAFNSQALRRKLHDIGVVENIHLSSHGTKKKSTVEGVKRRNEKPYRFEGSQTWFANGHREMYCKCGKGKVARRIRVDTSGKAIVSSQGECRHGCGTIRVTAGLWRVSTDGKTFRRVRPGERDSADWTIGNPLTFNDEVAESYGVPRYNAQEGMFGSQFTTRFKLLKNKRWFRRQSQVEMEVSMVISITHVLSIERYRRMAAGSPPLTQGAPPLLALAA